MKPLTTDIISSDEMRQLIFQYVSFFVTAAYFPPADVTIISVCVDARTFAHFYSDGLLSKREIEQEVAYRVIDSL